VPTRFTVPNPPQPLSTGRRPLKRTAIDVGFFGGSSSPSDGGATTSTDTLTSPPSCKTARYDHSYAAPRTSEPHDTDQQVTPRRVVSTTGGVRRKIISDREKRLRTIILRQQVKICRLRKKVLALSATSRQPKFDMLANGNNVQANKQLNAFFARQLRLSRCKKVGRRYSPSDKNFALSLYFLARRLILFVSVFLFCHRNARSKFGWLNLTSNLAFVTLFFSVLRNKVRSMAEQDRVCVLLLDEMSLKTALSYDGAKDVIVGFEDYGHLGTGKQLANSALVFMVKGIRAKWKQPIGYFLTHNSTAADNWNYGTYTVYFHYFFGYFWHT
jgi:hypothetical protein